MGGWFRTEIPKRVKVLYNILFAKQPKKKSLDDMLSEAFDDYVMCQILQLKISPAAYACLRSGEFDLLDHKILSNGMCFIFVKVEVFRHMEFQENVSHVLALFDELDEAVKTE